MTPWLTRLANDTNGRPFSSEEIDRITLYGERLPDALAAVRKLEDNQKWLVRHLTEWVAPKAQQWGLPKDPFTTDFASFLSAVGYALVCDDLTVLEATVVAPCQTLADALEVPAEEFAGLFDEAWRVLAQRLDPTAAGLLAPYFDRAAEGLRNGPPSPMAVTETPPPFAAETEFPPFSAAPAALAFVEV